MLVLEPTDRAARRARSWLRRLYEPEVGEDDLERAQLVLSELVTNAVRHGRGDAVVRSAIDGVGRLIVSVTDSGPGVPERLPVDPTRLGGFGLIVVGRLAAEWGFADFPGGKTVWARLHVTWVSTC